MGTTTDLCKQMFLERTSHDEYPNGGVFTQENIYKRQCSFYLGISSISIFVCSIVFISLHLYCIHLLSHGCPMKLPGKSETAASARRVKTQKAAACQPVLAIAAARAMFQIPRWRCRVERGGLCGASNSLAVYKGSLRQQVVLHLWHKKFMMIASDTWMQTK